MKKHENKKICEACGGHCCGSSPGMYIPSDFGKPKERMENMLAAIKAGKVMLDSWVDGRDGKDIYYLRPKSTHDDAEFMYFSMGGGCVLQTDDGCTLKLLG